MEKLSDQCGGLEARIADDMSDDVNDDNITTTIISMTIKPQNAKALAEIYR